MHATKVSSSFFFNCTKKLRSMNGIGTFVQNVGAADKAAIQLVKVQPYQLLVSDT